MSKIQDFSFHTFWKKDNWPKAYAGPRLPTLLYINQNDATYLKPTNLYAFVPIYANLYLFNCKQ